MGYAPQFVGVNLTHVPPAEAPNPAPWTLHVLVIALYVGVAVLFAWPLPLHLSNQLPGPVSEDTGVYVWNLWVFRHEIVAHHHFPFATLEILSLAAPVPLALHNYTTIADVIAFPLLPLLGTVRTFNVLIIGSGVLAAYAMFVFAGRLVRSASAAWLAGLLFGFSPYMSARTSEHFSLVQTAPLVLFALLLERLRSAPTVALGAAAGAVTAAAYLCDPYYAVYCVLMAAFMLAYSAMAFHSPDPALRSGRALRISLDAVIACLVLLAAWILRTGGGRLAFGSVRVSATQLYTPILLLTVALAIRLWIGYVRPRLTWVTPAVPPVSVIAAAVIVCIALIAPVVLPVAAPTGERQWISPKVFWRSSAPGLDVLTFFLPNPMQPLFGRFFVGWLSRLPHTPIENVSSIPWTVLAIIALAARSRRAFAPRYWAGFTVVFACLALGPFVHLGGYNLYVPTPWTLLRYVPVVGAARMPTRMAAVVMLGVAVLFAFGVREIMARARRPAVLLCTISLLLLVELLPAPRTTYSAAVPRFFDIVAADPRPVAVLSLPFGMKDGLRSYGDATPTRQFFQTVHGKPLIGGYVSRLPSRDVQEYTQRVVTAALIDLSEGRSLTPERRAAVVVRAHEMLSQMNIGYVVVATTRASAELIQLASDAFDLKLVAVEGDRMLFRTRLASPAAGLGRPVAELSRE